MATELIFCGHRFSSGKYCLEAFDDTSNVHNTEHWSFDHEFVPCVLKFEYEAELQALRSELDEVKAERDKLKKAVVGVVREWERAKREATDTKHRGSEWVSDFCLADELNNLEELVEK